jgi:hypothetical protein
MEYFITIGAMGWSMLADRIFTNEWTWLGLAAVIIALWILTTRRR